MLVLVILVVHLYVHLTTEDGFWLALHHGELAVLDSSDQEFILEFLISPTGLHQLSNNTHQGGFQIRKLGGFAPANIQ